MLVSGSAMWLLILVLAFSASISACEGPCECSNNTTQLTNSSESFNQIECLDKLTSLIDELSSCVCQSIAQNSTSDFLEIKCVQGIPLVETLPREVTSLVIQNADKYEVTNLLMALENVSMTCLTELTIFDSSLTGFNMSWNHFPNLVMLNISANDLVSLSDVRMNNESGLRVLDLSSNHLSELSSETFRTLTGLVRLSLRNNKIERVDENAFIGLTALEDLDMSDNKLILLPDDTLIHLASLQTLNLSGNQLRILGARWFEALGRLRELDVSRNGLTKAASGVLQPLPGLSVLRLAENPLMERDVSLLLGTGRRLETVDASRTGLVRVPAALTRSVRALRLAGNKLTCIRDGDFDGYPLLKILDLSDNLLNDIEEDSLGRLETLEKLDLSRNKLKIVPRSLPSSLLSLDLHSNNIESLNSNDLQGIENLRRLLLNNNSIEKIEEGAFCQLFFLTELDISNNPIRQLPANTLAGPTHLTELRMSGITSLEWEHEERGDMTFPIPSPEMIVSLDISHSPVLTAQLLADNAALSACKSLVKLNLINTNITSLRSDLVYILPQLSTLGLSDNDWNCTTDLLWLGEWIRQHEEIKPSAKCNSNGDFTDIPLAELSQPPTTTTTSLRYTTTNTIATTATTIPVTTNLAISDTSYQHPIEKYSKLVVPNASSNDSIIYTTESMLMRAKTSNVPDEIVLTQIQSDDTIVVGLNDDNQLIGMSTTLKTSTRGVDNAGQILKPKKKPLIIVDNKRLGIENKDTKIKRPESRKTNEQSELVRENKERQRLQEILDNRVDSVEREDKSFPTKSATKSDDGIQLKMSNTISRHSASSRHDFEIKDDEVTNKIKKAQNFAFANNIANTIAEELNGRAANINERSVTGISTHPGMLVLIGAVIGAAAALTVVLSRRATTRRRDRYHRHENIEVHTLTPTTELW